jgi:hypothetical protein
MARPTVDLIVALRETATALERPSTRYQWSHFAHCNCGHLAQTLTRLAPRVLYEAAFQRPGDWADQAAAADWGDRPALDEGAWEPPDAGVCSATGMTLDVVFDQMLVVGLDREDIRHLERLSDPLVLRRLGKNTTGLAHNVRENVVAYMHAWADLLEDSLDRTAEPLPIAAE